MKGGIAMVSSNISVSQDLRSAFRKNPAARDEELAMLERYVEFLRRNYPLRFMQAVARATRSV